MPAVPSGRITLGGGASLASGLPVHRQEWRELASPHCRLHPHRPTVRQQRVPPAPQHMRQPTVQTRIFWTAAWLLSLGSLCASLQAQLPTTPSGDSRLTAPRTNAAGFRRTPALKPPPRPAGDPRLARFDPATRLLVEMELRDATPADREHWLSLIATVDADQVQHLLSARRRAAGDATRSTAVSPQQVSANRPSPQAVTTQRPAHPPAVTPVSSTQVQPATTSSPPASPDAALPAPSPAAMAAPVTPPVTSPPTSAIPDQAPEATAATPRRGWMAPLRHRWGDGRSTQPTPDPVATEAPPLTAVIADRPAADAETRSSAYMNVELQRVMTLLRTEIVDAEKSGLSPSDPKYRRMQVQMRLLHLLADEPEQALQAIPHLPAEQQEFWTQFLWALTNELDAPDQQADDERLRRTAELLTSAERHLRQAAPLAVSQACFCHRINSFGNYDRFPQDEFRPGQPVLVYAEVQNFNSDAGGDGLYRTRMRSVVDVLPAGPTGEPVPTAVPLDRREFPATEDASRSLRNDYFHSYRIDLSPQLAAGSYWLRLTLTDDLSGKSAVTAIPFVIR